MDLQTLCLKISRSENLPVLPTVVVQILRLFDDPACSPKLLEKCVEQDPALAAKVIRVAGSSMYGKQGFQSVGRALSVLGMNTLRSIAISLAYQQIITHKGGKPSFDKLVFWRHSLAVGVGAKAILNETDRSKADEAYIAGLMHDIGLLALEKFSQPTLDASIRRAKTTHCSLGASEQIVVGYDHAEVGGILAEKWKLSMSIQHAVLYHDRPWDDPENLPTTMAVAAANLLAYECGFPAIDDVVAHLNRDEVIGSLGLSDEQIERIKENVIQEVANSDGQVGAQRAA